jgi:hypothetical protein
MESPAPVTLPTIHPNGANAANLKAEYREFEQAAIRFWQQVKNRRSAAQSHD